jgi:hypothetical protein
VFEAIDIIPLGFDKRKSYRSHSKLGLNQYQYSSEKLVRNTIDEGLALSNIESKRGKIKLIMSKNSEGKT